MKKSSEPAPPVINVHLPPAETVKTPEPILTKREEVWLRAWTSVCTAENCLKAETASSWANRCLSDFNSKFPKMEGQT